MGYLRAMEGEQVGPLAIEVLMVVAACGPCRLSFVADLIGGSRGGVLRALRLFAYWTTRGKEDVHIPKIPALKRTLGPAGIGGRPYLWELTPHGRQLLAPWLGERSRRLRWAPGGEEAGGKGPATTEPESGSSR